MSGERENYGERCSLKSMVSVSSYSYAEDGLVRGFRMFSSSLQGISSSMAVPVETAEMCVRGRMRSGESVSSPD